MIDDIGTLTRTPVPPVKMIRDDLMSPIQLTVLGIRIDLDSVVAISDAYTLPHNYSSKSPSVCFDITFKSDIPNGPTTHFQWICPTRHQDISKEEYEESSYGRYKSSWEPITYYKFVHDEFEWKNKLQKVIDHIVEMWESWKLQTLRIAQHG